MEGERTWFDASGGEVAPAGVRDDSSGGSPGIDRRYRPPGPAEPTTTRDVEPRNWVLARHILAVSATSIARHSPGWRLDDA